jgi:predicted helicase
MTVDNNNTSYTSTYAAIARSIFATGNSHVLTFHGTDLSARSFANESEFRRVFQAITAHEFPDMVSRYVGVRVASVSGGDSGDDRRATLDAFASCPDNEVFLVASCRTIGEGIDSAAVNANHAVWLDGDGGGADIVQNVGRLTRRFAASGME